uniref:WGS project CAEQ00000000 data, annotated contig 199 n=1 Tax=Trypanosoma congolense (strain IL3000) TaxID=1068625 RepID=F9WAM1_TRYCI|nr:unnamed protein product [Trypanosoma congolense IL3000]
MPVGDLWRDLYEAETLSDASRAVLSSAPRWAPWVGAGAFFISYVGFIRVKIFIGKWRRAARKRAERKFLTISQWQSWETTPAYAELSLTGEGDGGGDGDDDSDVEERCGNGCEDRTMLTLDDIDEFRKSLRLRLPRDNDLLVSIEEMLLVDEIPDGWVLYRTTAGVVRFMNLNTQELAYFPPGQREKEYHIRKELRRRSRLEAARKCTLLCGGDVNSVGHFGVSQAYPADQLLNGSNGDRALSTSRSSGEGQEDRDSQGDAQRHNESSSCEDQDF